MSEQRQDYQQATNVQNVAYKGYQDGSVEFYGDQIEILTGYPRKSFNSKQIRWVDIIYPEDKESVRQSFVQALKGDKTYMRQYRIISKAETLRWIQEWGQIVCTDTNTVDYVTGILVDVSEQKRIEEEQRKVEQRSGKYLIFKMAGSEYGIDILKIKEIIGMLPVTPVPNTMDHVKGVVNLRGKVIPVIDLRSRFNLAEIPYTDRTCIIVVEIRNAGRNSVFGIAVDGVSEVLHLDGQDITDAPPFGAEVDTRYILGMARTKEGVRILLDVDQSLDGNELTDLDQVA